MPIIKSLLDNDLYKLTMQQAVLHQFSDIDVKYKFRCRTQGIDLRPYIQEIAAEIDHLCTLQFTPEELEYLSQLNFIKPNYIRHLRVFRFDRSDIVIKEGAENLELTIRGSWYFTILLEVPILAIINEVYFRHACPEPETGGIWARLDAKIDLLRNTHSFKFADFGTRRRFAFKWQANILERLVTEDLDNFVGTSNVFFAKKFGIRPIGTMAHEWIQAGQAVGVPVVDSQRFMLQKWADEYRGDLGVALSDTIGVDAFLSDFDLYFSKLYAGVRQDSGDPISFGERMITHYQSLGIDPMTKTIIFSDGLNFPRAKAILEHFRGRIMVSFGIGTNLTNDVPNCEPIQIVIKMLRCNGKPVAKISDTPGKNMGEDREYIHYLKKVFDEKVSKK